ncbi:MAG: hypothetical protein EP346_05055 [Bacteroidetes bacterium]|nr:MAG: hypothetical protein EP346_05055 [Bacteroidota bacterium]
MKRIAASFLIFTLVLPQLLQMGTMMNYVLQMKTIEEQFCVNKDKPELECHGTCHLKSELTQLETSAQPDPAKKTPQKPAYRSLEFIANIRSTELSFPLIPVAEQQRIPLNCGSLQRIYLTPPHAPPQLTC